jgi:hypothetical protein
MSLKLDRYLGKSQYLSAEDAKADKITSVNLYSVANNNRRKRDNTFMTEGTGKNRFY